MALVPCILVSVGYIIMFLFMAEFMRRLVDPLNPSLLKTALYEAIAAAEMCSTGFELIIVADNYGIMAYSVCLFLLTIWFSDHWGDATACPYNHFEECAQGRMSVKETLVRTLAQTLGGVAVFRLVQLLWSIEITETHIGRSHSHIYDVCTADLTVPVLTGAAIEAVATLVCRLGSRLIALKEPHYGTAIDSFIATTMVILAFDTSGGYLNPVLATALKFGCRGHTPVEHFLVYWVGASLGSLASVYVWPYVEEAVPQAAAALEEDAKKQD
jgi:aquaporin related protein